MNYGGDRAEEFDGALGQYSFDGQFDGENRFEYGQGVNNGDMFYGMGDYDYSTGWGDSDYFGDTGMTMVIDSNGKIGVNKPAPNSNGVHHTGGSNPYVQTSSSLIHTASSPTQVDKDGNAVTGSPGLSQALHDIKQVGTHPHYDEDNLTRYWSFMHRLWGQASANQREFIDPIGSEVGSQSSYSQVLYGEDKPGKQGGTDGSAFDGIAESYTLNAQVSDNAAVAGTTLYPSRWYGYHENNHDVTNNLSAGKDSERLAGRFVGGDVNNPLYDIMESKRGRHGKTLYDFYGGFYKDGSSTEGVRIANEPWDILNSHERETFSSTTGRTADAWEGTWGFTQGNIKIDADNTAPFTEELPVFGDMGKNLDEQIFVDTGFFDSSWELGKPLLGKHVDPRGEVHLQQDQRWFEDINSSSAVARDSALQGSVGTDSTNERDDNAKMECFHCEIQYGLHWNPIDKHFYTRDRDNVADAATGSVAAGYGAWGDCERRGEPRTCEYSSGVCFVEERRTFGYITLVRKGCKQAQACYMQKYQNFLVQAGRQCWPGDGRGSSMKVASRPHDVMADQWIYNLVSGGNTYEDTDAGQWPDFMDIHYPQSTERATNNIASTFDFKYNQFNDGNSFAYARNEFDNTFVDVDRDGQVDRRVFHAGPYVANTAAAQFDEMREIHGPTYGFYKVIIMICLSFFKYFFRILMPLHNCHMTQTPHQQKKAITGVMAQHLMPASHLLLIQPQILRQLVEQEHSQIQFQQQ